MSSIPSPDKKILFIVTQAEMGGAQRFLHNLLNNERMKEFEIILAAGPQGDQKFNLLEINKYSLKTRLLKHLVREISPWRDTLALWEIFNLIRRERPATLFLCSTKAGILGSIAGKLLIAPGFRPRVIYRIGGWAFNEKLSLLKREMYLRLEKDTARWKDKIIVNTDFERQQAVKLRICPENKIVTVYNGLNPEKVSFLEKTAVAEKILPGKSPEKEIVVGAIANLYQNKGLNYLAQAAHILFSQFQIANVKFIIIGEGRERDNLEKLIVEYGLKDKFILAGAIPDAAKYLKAFDIFVLPSVKEGMPWTILEAMLAGLPIIATKVGGLPEMIADNESGLLVEPANPEQLAAAIKRLAEDENLRRRLGENALKKVKEKFSEEKMVEETIKIIRN